MGGRWEAERPQRGRMVVDEGELTDLLWVCLGWMMHHLLKPVKFSSCQFLFDGFPCDFHPTAS